MSSVEKGNVGWFSFNSINRKAKNPNQNLLPILEVLLEFYEYLIDIGNANSKEKIWYPPHSSRVDAAK